MVKINGNNITLTRGNSFEGIVTIKQGDETYTPAEGDTVRFLMRNIYQDDEAVIDKTLNNLTLSLDPKDTEDLPCRTYLYNVKLEQASGDAYTFIEGYIELTQEAENA